MVMDFQGDELARLELKADNYGRHMHLSDEAAMKWLQTIRLAAELRTRTDPVAFRRHQNAMCAQRITAAQADEAFFRMEKPGWVR